MTPTLELKRRTGDSLVIHWLRVCLPGRGHGCDPWPRKIPHAHACTTTTEPAALEPVLADKRSHCSEKPAHHNSGVAPAHCIERKPECSREDPGQPKINK